MIFNGTIPIPPEFFIASVMPMICTCMYNPLDRLRNLCQVQNWIKGSESVFLFISLRERFLTTGTCTYKMPRRNRIPLEHRERESLAFEDEQEDYLLVADTFQGYRGALHHRRQNSGETKRWKKQRAPGC